LAGALACRAAPSASLSPHRARGAGDRTGHERAQGAGGEHGGEVVGGEGGGLGVVARTSVFCAAATAALTPAPPRGRGRPRASKVRAGEE